MEFADKNQFGTGNLEDRIAAPLPSESLDEMEELETDPRDEFADDDEFAELSEEEMEPFTVADWKQEFPDYTAEELEEKIPESRRASKMELIISCLMGTLLGAAISGVLVNNQPRSQETRAFFIFFLVLAPLFSFIWYWFFVLQADRVAKKIKDEQEANLTGSEPLASNKELAQADPVGSKPIHPK